MIIKLLFKPVSSLTYVFKEHTLYPCLRAFVVFVFTGAVIVYKDGPLSPWWGAAYFAFALWTLWYPYSVYKKEKVNS